MLRENDFLQSFDGHQLRPLKGIAFYQPEGWSTCGAGPRRSHLAFWQKFQKNITKTSKNFLIKKFKKFPKRIFKKNSKRTFQIFLNKKIQKSKKSKKNLKKLKKSQLFS